MTKVVAIVGTYRKGGTVDLAVDAVLDAARERGAETSKIYLLDKHIEFCTNCRSCTQQPGERRGRCVINDEMDAVLNEIESADALVLGAPVNAFNVTAIFRRFMERLVCFAHWPWGMNAPQTRSKKSTRKAVLITSTAMPGMFIPLATGAPRALKTAATLLGARPVGKLWIGLAAGRPKQELPQKVLAKARRIGASLA
ncbi:MAG TPA: flavodoxin family protein [Clostridia bacterium]|nr:flavodoxin family protein [Clostridia bacterium]